MRKYYLRWWFTRDWEHARHQELIRHWHAIEPHDYGIGVRWIIPFQVISREEFARRYPPA